MNFRCGLRHWAAVLAVATVSAALMLAGCGDGAADLEDDDLPPGARIISLSPAISQMLIDMGLGDHIVGRNDRDPILADRDQVPAVASFATGQWQFQTEALLDRRPTHVLLEGRMPEQLRTLAQRGRFAVINYPTPNSLEDIQRMILDPAELAGTSGEPPRSIGVVFHALYEADRLSLRLSRQLRAVRDVIREAQAARDKPQPRVLVVLELTEGGMTVSGRDTVYHELLSTWLSAVNAAAEPPDPSEDNPFDAMDQARPAELDDPAPVLSRELLIEYARPDVIILLDPGGPRAARPVLQDSRVAALGRRGLAEAVPAIANERIVIINHPMGKLPSSSIGGVVAEMAKAIYPDFAGRINQAMEDAKEELPAPEDDDDADGLDIEVGEQADSQQGDPAAQPDAAAPADGN